MYFPSYTECGMTLIVFSIDRLNVYIDDDGTIRDVHFG